MFWFWWENVDFGHSWISKGLTANMWCSNLEVDHEIGCILALVVTPVLRFIQLPLNLWIDCQNRVKWQPVLYVVRFWYRSLQVKRSCFKNYFYLTTCIFIVSRWAGGSFEGMLRMSYMYMYSTLWRKTESVKNVVDGVI